MYKYTFALVVKITHFMKFEAIKKLLKLPEDPGAFGVVALATNNIHGHRDRDIKEICRNDKLHVRSVMEIQS